MVARRFGAGFFLTYKTRHTRWFIAPFRVVSVPMCLADKVNSGDLDGTALRSIVFPSLSPAEGLTQL